ncbi:MAG: VanZ family protein [Anaerolineae bacterium]|nr:VanZ family protein [Anaerolineae bacterium]
MRSRLSWVWWTLSAAVAVWLLWMTLRPNQTVAADLALLTEPAAEQGISAHLLIDLAGNVVVFAPLGAALSLALRDRPVRRRLLLATLGGAGLSLIIELIQTAIPSRVTALDDWLLNTGGAFLGALAGCVVGRKPEIGD